MTLIKFHPDWRSAWRWFSIQAMALDAAFLIAWATVPDDLKAYLPSWIGTVIAVATLIVGMVGRLVKQRDPDEAPKPTEVGK